jgi:protein involved in sex pheromone biosynthesis
MKKLSLIFLTITIFLFLTGCAGMIGNRSAKATYNSCINSGRDNFTCQQAAEQSYYRAVNNFQNAMQRSQQIMNSNQTRTMTCRTFMGTTTCDY